jgi:hypothetical protein
LVGFFFIPHLKFSDFFIIWLNLDFEFFQAFIDEFVLLNGLLPVIHVFL